MERKFFLEKEVYVAPALEVLCVAIEQGFAATAPKILGITPAANSSGNDDYTIDLITFEGGWED